MEADPTGGPGSPYGPDCARSPTLAPSRHVSAFQGVRGHGRGQPRQGDYGFRALHETSGHPS